MTIATLVDTQAADQKSIEALYKDKLLKKANVLTFADFTGSQEADVEDMFGDEFILHLFNSEFAKELVDQIELKNLTSKSPRIVSRIEAFLEENPLKVGRFSHYRPARFFVENVKDLAPEVPELAADRFQAAFDALNKLLPK